MFALFYCPSFSRPVVADGSDIFRSGFDWNQYESWAYGKGLRLDDNRSGVGWLNAYDFQFVTGSGVAFSADDSTAVRRSCPTEED